MKSTLISLIALVSSVSALAGTIELTTYAKVYEDQGGRLQELVTYLPGTRLVVEDYSSSRSRGQNLHKVLKVRRPNSFTNPYRVDKSYDINNNSGYVNFYMSERDYNRSIDLSNNRRPVIEPTRPVRPTRPAYDRESYVRCFERPSQMVTRVNQSKRDRGNGRLVGGGAIALIGQLAGGDVGDVLTVVGAGVAIAGVIDLSTAKEQVFQGSYYDCQRYYTRGRTINDRRNRGCTVTRYYSSSWEGTTEYFERTCGRNQGSYHFNRAEVDWRY